MNLNTSTATDNITDLLNRIIDFTDRRKEVLSRNLFDYRQPGFTPSDLPVQEFASAMTEALAEHLQSKRLILKDSHHIHFLDQGEFDAAPVPDDQAEQLLGHDVQAYVDQQIQKMSENMIHNRIACELLRQKRQNEMQCV